MINKRLINTGVEAAAAFDPLQNFETVTYTGNGGTQKITGYIRKGAAFDGSSSYITSSLSKTDIANTFSVSFWWNPNTLSGYQSILGHYEDVGNIAYGWSIVQANNKIGFYWVISASPNTSNYFENNTILQQGQWYHIVATITPTSANLYVDKSSASSSPNQGSDFIIEYSSNPPFYMGRQNGANTYYANGKIDQVRIFNKALSSSEVTTLYGETYASSTKSTTDIFGDGSGVALYELDEDALSSNFEQAAVFNGSSSKITIPEISPASISMWVNVNSTSGIDALMGHDSISANYIYWNTGDLTVNGVIFTDLDKVANQWVHIVLVESGSNIICYKDGSPIQTLSGSLGAYNLIGARTAGTAQYTTGKIDQVRLYSSVLSSTDVEKLYNESADVPTANLVAYYKLDGDATDETETYDGVASNVTYSTGVYGGTPTNVNFLGMAFQPDLVWFKERNGINVHQLYDTIRGDDFALFSNTTDAQYNYSTHPNGDLSLASFDSNGFTLPAVTNNGLNASGQNYVAWCWKAAGAANTFNVLENGTVTSDSTASGAGITAGSITTGWEVSANRDAGFSIVKYTGNGTAGATVGHGLSSTPELVIVKSTSEANNWWAGVKDVDGVLQLDSTSAVISSGGTNGAIGKQSTYTSTVFGFLAGLVSVDNANKSGQNYIAYCFHSVDGYQKVGSYSGDSSAAITVTTGFKPRFLMIKMAVGTSSTYTGWVMFDYTRDIDSDQDNPLYANASYAEGLRGNGTGSADDAVKVQFTDTGFIVDPDLNRDGETNEGAGSTYIYLAIA